MPSEFGSVEFILDELGGHGPGAKGSPLCPGKGDGRKDVQKKPEVLRGKLEVVIEGRTLLLSTAKCRLILAALAPLHAFASGTAKVSARTPHGTLRSVRMNKAWVLELTERGSSRPTRISAEQARSLLACEGDVRRFALSR